MALKKVLSSDNAERFKFVNPGDTLEGYLLQSAPKMINGREVTEHLFQTPNGLTSTLGNFKLNESLATIQPGTFVRATFTSIKKLKVGNMKMFDVEYDDEDVIPVGNSTKSASAQVSQREEAPSLEDSDFSSIDEDLEEAPMPLPSRVTSSPKSVSASQAEEVRRVLNAKRTRS